MVCSVVTVYYVLRSKGVSSLIIIPLFATAAVDTGRAKFVTGVLDTRGAPLIVNISANFRKKFEMTLMLFSGAWGKMIHEKNQ